MKLKTITFTGVDAQTDISLLPKEGAEYGFLYSMKQSQVTENHRYMKLEEIKSRAEILHSRGYKLALHICGRKATEQIVKKDKELLHLIKIFDRVQVNGSPSISDIEEICSHLPEKEIITQHHSKNAYLLDVKSSNHSILLDNSGGRGIYNGNDWDIPATQKKIGFAGGISIENVLDVVSMLEKVFTRGYWIDMEGKIRTQDDYFDIQKIKDIYNFKQWIERVNISVIRSEYDNS